MGIVWAKCRQLEMGCSLLELCRDCWDHVGCRADKCSPCCAWDGLVLLLHCAPGKANGVCVCVEGFMSKCRVLLTGSSPSVLAAVCDTSQAVQGDAASRADPGLSWLC